MFPAGGGDLGGRQLLRDSAQRRVAAGPGGRPSVPAARSDAGGETTARQSNVRPPSR
jgi:hypothetical protein